MQILDSGFPGEINIVSLGDSAFSHVNSRRNPAFLLGLPYQETWTSSKELFTP